MRAAVLDDHGFTVRDAPEPAAPGPGEALVAPVRVGICGSDAHFVIDGSAKTDYRPIVLGHEAAGEVVALGPDTDGPAPGTRVALIPLVTCQECDRCLAGRSVLCLQRQCLGAEREGAFAERILLPARNLVPIPDGLSWELAAVATDSVATAYHAVVARGGAREGSRVVVWGTGGLGLSAVGIAKAVGAAEVVAVDLREDAREWALETGADAAYHPDEALERIGGRMDVALEFVGRSSTVEGAVRSLDDGGRAVVVGIGHEPAAAGRLITFVMRERELVGSYGNEPEEVGAVLELMASGKLVLPRVVGDVIPLADVAAGVERVHRGQTGGSRIVVDITA
ncbi:MAG: alcohol dehydrogenase catalytic domain-containing protein [Solirubrobacteraceae bacterium]|nr:alcohol dehydrogenase catalytic domain-containing protein [Solirubrobacteraceae bacterium]